MKSTVLFLAIITLLAGAWYFMRPTPKRIQTSGENAQKSSDDAMVAVKVPASFSEQELIGKRAFEAVCSKCHGTNAQGREGKGPPLVHKIYEPSHHGDMAFVLAAQNGVRSHHWQFGSMPPVEGVTKGDVLNIVAYVRALQSENGID